MKPTPPTAPALETGSTLARPEFARRLVNWFGHAQRDLPWRLPQNARDPYRVLISEVMLQQTTVAAAVPYYLRFIARFPTIQSLAVAPAEEVLSHWAGLGYYQRARNLHACAQVVLRQHDGIFPRDFEKILALPGIGRYTAGAVSSIAFDTPAPIVDANVARVFARVFCLEGDLKAPHNQRRLWQEAESLVQTCDDDCLPSNLNPALMELGALICTPREPRCEHCPVNEYCLARATGRANELPHATPKPQIIEMRDVCALVHRTNAAGAVEILLRQRDNDDSGAARNWWRGMWELPRTTLAPDEKPHDALRRLLQDELHLAKAGTTIEFGSQLKTLQHGVTHHRITLECWAASLESEPDSAARWFTSEAALPLAMPSIMRRLLDWLHRHVVANQQLPLL